MTDPARHRIAEEGAEMREVVEKVARAIANAMDVDPDVFIGMHGRHKWEKQWHPLATAAIEALGGEQVNRGESDG